MLRLLILRNFFQIFLSGQMASVISPGSPPLLPAKIRPQLPLIKPGALHGLSSILHSRISLFHIFYSGSNCFLSDPIILSCRYPSFSMLSDTIRPVSGSMLALKPLAITSSPYQ